MKRACINPPSRLGRGRDVTSGIYIFHFPNIIFNLGEKYDEKGKKRNEKKGEKKKKKNRLGEALRRNLVLKGEKRYNFPPILNVPTLREIKSF